MQILNALLLVAVLAGVFYCARLLRALHGKVSALMSAHKKGMKELKQMDWQSYRQIEALQQILLLLKFSAPIPPMRNWAASPDLLLTITDLVRTHKPGLVVELGSGVSTLILAKAGAKKVISIDDSEEFAGKTRELLKTHGIRGVEIRVAALQSHFSGVDWYDTSKLQDLKKIDLLIIDGPPGSKNPAARSPAHAEFINRISPKAIIIIDDVNRDGERELALTFAQSLPNHVLTFYPHEKGTAVISPK